MPYSNDLRCKLREAWRQWDGTQPEWAQLFGVSRSYLQKGLRRWRQTGDMTAPVSRHGPGSRLEPARRLRLVAAHPDATLAELGAHLHLSASDGCRALQKVGLRRKRRRSTPPSATPRGTARSGGPGSARVSDGARGGWSSWMKAACTSP